jgi:hypothetical protein
LHALGFLGFVEARDALWTCARNDPDYYAHRAASLGLLNLPCEGLEHEIEAAIRGCEGKNLFPEFLPLLAHKVNNPELLRTIFDVGRTTASTDCNGGIVYGVTLFGEAGRPYFDQLLFDPYWEASGSGTGTRWWAYHGFRHLGGSLARLALQIRASHAALPPETFEYRVRVWLALATCWLGEPLSPIRGEVYPHERAVDVFSAALDWSSANGDDSLSGLVRSGNSVVEDTYALRQRLDDRVSADVLRGVLPTAS